MCIRDSPTSTKTSHLDISATNNATHVYIKVDKPESLCPKFEGPYPIYSRPSRSQITVNLGQKRNGDLRLQTYHWSSAKVAHMRKGFLAAQRPKLGRPASNPQGTSLSSNTASEQNSNGNPSVNLQAADCGEATGSTDKRQQSSSSAPSHSSARPIRSRRKKPKRPITAASDKQNRPANFQTTKTIEPAVSRPVRTTRNRSPVYTDNG